MFKIPAWEDDSHGNQVANILKVPKVKKKPNKTNQSPNTKQNGVMKPSFKTKNNKRNKINSAKKTFLKNNLKSKGNIQQSNKIANDSQIDKLVPIEAQSNHVKEATSLKKKQKRHKKNRKKNALLTNNVSSEKPSIVDNKQGAKKSAPMSIQSNNEKTSLKRKQESNKNNTKPSKVVKNKQLPEKTVEVQTNHKEKRLLKQKQDPNNTKPSNIVNNKQSTEIPKPMKIQTDKKTTTLTKKQNKNPKKNKNKSKDKVNLNNYDTDKLDELILIEKKKKLNKVKNDNIEENVLFNENAVENKTKIKIKKKKEYLKALLQKQSNRNHISVKSESLRNRMLEKLKAAKFRYLNEKLYTTTGSEAQKLFKEDPAAFQTYHEGYQQQMKKWPVKPLDIIIQRIQKMPKSYKIVDMGCGEAELSKRISQTVRSFDLIARAENVEECDIAHTPVLAATMDVAVYCLALMGTNLTQYLLEANRVLRMGGHLLIAEVESRFNKVDDFVSDVQKLGFSLKKLDKSHEVFFFMEFTKIRDPPSKKGKIPHLTLKPCIYKRR